MNANVTEVQAKREEARTIYAIAKRAVSLAKEHGAEIDLFTMDMDLTFCHINTPLRLDDLLAANNANFSHDVFGIRKHLNRDTGKLGDCFLPRFHDHKVMVPA